MGKKIIRDPRVQVHNQRVIKDFYEMACSQNIIIVGLIGKKPDNMPTCFFDNAIGADEALFTMDALVHHGQKQQLEVANNDRDWKKLIPPDKDKDLPRITGKGKAKSLWMPPGRK
jgi:hypothetical protein